MVDESLAPEASVTEVARRYDVHPNLLHLWRRQAREGTLIAGRDAEVAADGGCRFVPVAVAPIGGATASTRGDASAGPAVIEVVLRNGRLLRLPEGVVAARAALLADALEGCGR
jgi:transposase